MKINKLLITALSCILLTSCSVKEVQRTSHNQDLDDFQQEFIEKNDVEVLCCNVGDNEEVITFVNDEGYGLATFFYDDAMDNIQYEIIKLDNSFDSRKVHYGQVKGKDNF